MFSEDAKEAYHIPELCSYEAVPLACMIRNKQISAVEVMSDYLDHIEAVNPLVNAIVSTRPREELFAEAQSADRAVSTGGELGPLHGVPQAIKDTADTKGLLTTYGSPLFKDFVPQADAIFVARMRAAGAIIIGKTNVPEFGFGSNSYNTVFGLTRNAYDRGRVAGGSSGGAAVALAMRMLSVADGSDMGGSLRNPAAFNNVLGFRPSQGMVPEKAADAFYGQMPVSGPMGRTVEDVTMLLGVQAGFDSRAPLSLDPPVGWLDNLRPLEPGGKRFGWLGDYGGHLSIEPGLLELTRAAAEHFARAGATVDDASTGFDMERLWNVFLTLRSQSIGGMLNDAYRDETRRIQLKPEARWEVERSYRQSALDVYKAGIGRAEWHEAVMRLFERFDYLLLPAAQVFPFDASENWPKHVAGREMDSYHRWMEVVIGPTLAGLPAISVPAGFDNRGLPAGLQIIGPPRGDRSVLEAAKLYEELNPWLSRLPPRLSFG